LIVAVPDLQVFLILFSGHILWYHDYGAGMAVFKPRK
jgi:hypothetical protein